MTIRYPVLILIVTIFFIFHAEESHCRDQDNYQSFDDKYYSRFESQADKTLSIKLKSSISLDELIKKTGYSISNDDIVPFLSEFLKINKDISSISILKKGTVVKLPLKNLKKVGENLLQAEELPEKHKTKRKSVAKKEKVKKDIEISSISRELILWNIKLLSDSLDDIISIETEGFKFFSVNERSEISFDTSFFPVITVNKERVLILDYTGILPDEIKNIIEITWPEYRIVSNRGKANLKNIIRTLLKSMGYFVNSDRKVIIGGRTQIEYTADFLVFKNRRDLINSDINVIGIIRGGEYATPDNIVAWLKDRSVNLIELSYEKTKKYRRKESKVIQIAPDLKGREFTEILLTLLGYKYSRDSVFNLSDRKEYIFKLKADLSIDLGLRTKIIEFTDLYEYEINYAQKRGYDVVCIKPRDKRRNIVNKVMSLFSLNYRNSPGKNSSYITPAGAKYRLISPGIFVNSISGPVFITDSEFGAGLMKKLLDEKITLVTF